MAPKERIVESAVWRWRRGPANISKERAKVILAEVRRFRRVYGVLVLKNEIWDELKAADLVSYNQELDERALRLAAGEDG
jgi:hypothetical protein